MYSSSRPRLFKEILGWTQNLFAQGVARPSMGVAMTTDDDGVRTLLKVKKDGARTFLPKNKDGAKAFSPKK